MIPDHTLNASKVEKHNGTNDWVDIDGVMTRMPQTVDEIHIAISLNQNLRWPTCILSDSWYGKMIICDLTFASLAALKPCV